MNKDNKGRLFSIFLYKAGFCIIENFKFKRGLQLLNLHCGTDINFLKPKQVVTIKQALKNDCISVLPTGYGKSLIFEILPFVDFSVYDRQCLVLLICPLNVIIEQEIAKLGAKSITASDLVDKDESKDLKSILYIAGHQEDNHLF